MSSIQKRYDFALLFDVKSGNPNGDPDAGNAPRIDPETGHGLVSDVCLKRKIRNFVTLAKTRDDGRPEAGYDIYVKERSILNSQHQRAYDALGLKKEERTDPQTQEGAAEAGISEKKSKGFKGPKKSDKTEAIEKARQWMCQTFFDIRMFGAVMTTEVNAGQVRGPVQFAFARSIEPIVSLEQSVTRMAVTTERESQAQEGGNRTMGRKTIVPYGLYVAHGFISPQLATQTGFSDLDLELLWQALQMMFEHDRSAARGEMASQKLFVFEHESKLGNAPAHALFRRITTERKDSSTPARDFSDYNVGFDRSSFPTGITVHEKL